MKFFHSSDFVHIHRTKSAYSLHAPHQISSKSNNAHWSYWLNPTQRALIYLWVATKTQSPSDLAHIYSAGSTHSAHVFYQIWMKSNDTRPSYKRFPTQRAIIHIWTSGRLKEHLYTFELPPKRNPPPIELIFTGQIAHIVHMSPTKFDQNPSTPTEVIKRFQLKEHLYTFELPPKRNPPPI